MRRRGGDLVELSHAIHAEPELAFAEHRSCAKAQALVAERGFDITARAGGSALELLFQDTGTGFSDTALSRGVRPSRKA